ncbi:MAG: betaine/proline/choline family ABC transporter ATP-binding protein [Pseudomonadota bacterium]
MKHDEIVVELENVWKIFGERAIEAMDAIQTQQLQKADVLEQFNVVIGVKDASFKVKQGEIFCLMGLSGSGKSTLVRHINRLIDPTAGKIRILGQEIGRMSFEEIRALRSSKIGMVFQNMALLPHRSVRDNISFALELRGMDAYHRAQMADRALETVSLHGYGDRLPSELSGGMQQRVGLARALAADPEILLMDEPFSALDPLIRRNLQDEFLGLSANLHKTTIFITHDLDEAIRMGDRIAIMKDGEIVQTGTPEDIVTSPADDYVADFVSGISKLKLVSAAKIMVLVDQFEAQNGALDLKQTHLSVKAEDHLDTLVSLSTQTTLPVLIKDDGKIIGVIDKTTLLQGLQNNEPDHKGVNHHQSIQTQEIKPITAPKNSPSKQGNELSPVNKNANKNANESAKERDVSIGSFVATSRDYFESVFERIQKGNLPLSHFNIWALLIPWFWSAYRGVWLMFWIVIAIDVFVIVNFMQVVKYTPLLVVAELDASNNVTLIERYSRWIQNYHIIAIVALIIGRIWVACNADRLYYAQYSRWRIKDGIRHGVSFKRALIAGLIIALIVPITTYRATQQRLDERACLNQIRAAEAVNLMLVNFNLSNHQDLGFQLNTQHQTLKAKIDTLNNLSNRTQAQTKELSKIRKQERDLRRQIKTLDKYQNTSLKDKFDCWFIDDFPTLVRTQPPVDIVYRSVPDEEAIARGDLGAKKIITQVKPPIEGRLVNLFTYSAESIDKSINFLRAYFATIFDSITHILRQSLIAVETAFMEVPWIVIAFLFIVLSWAYTGPGTIAFVASSLAFLALFELWQVAMQTMALVVVSTALCVLIGLPVGIWMAKNKWAKWITEPILDVMQTIPSLSYLVPAVAFFGISQPPAVIATVVFAMPPMIKLTALGILQVPSTTKEAAVAFGARERQLLNKVELPMAIPSIMAGLNQTIMLALSMATISAFIGAEGLGAIVTASLGDAQAGKGLLAGIAIALIAMMIDRILKGIRTSFSRI